MLTIRTSEAGEVRWSPTVMSRRGLALAVCALVASVCAEGQVVTTIAGADWLLQPDGQPARSVAFGSLRGIHVDAGGRVFLSDSDNSLVVRIEANGTVRTIAGNGVRGAAGDGVTATRAPLEVPTAIATDARGNTYVGETGRVRRVGPDGNVSTIAGTGVIGFRGDGGPAVLAQIGIAEGMAFGPDGSLYIADALNYVVRRIGTDGIISTVAGTGSIPGFAGDGGPARQARLDFPLGIAVDTDGAIYIADSGNGAIRKVERSGTILTLNRERRGCPSGVAVDSSKRVYLADSCRRVIERILADGTTVTVGGNGPGFVEPSGDGGAATQAAFDMWAIAFDAGDNLYIAGPFVNRYYKITPAGRFTIEGGNGEYRQAPEGSLATRSFLWNPRGVAADSGGTLYIADSDSHKVRRIGFNGAMTTVAGVGLGRLGVREDGVASTSADLKFPTRVRPDRAGNLYVVDTFDHRVRRVSAQGVITTVAGDGTSGYSGDGGLATRARLFGPIGIALDAAGNLYIADSGNSAIRRVDTGGVITTVAGIGPTGTGFSGDGGSAISAQLNFPQGVEIGADGSIYIADTGNHRIRRVNPGGVIQTIAGSGTAGFSGDGGIATNARLRAPSDLQVAANGEIFVADRDNGRIRKVDSGGMITTVAGNGLIAAGIETGPALQVPLGLVTGLALDAAGNVYMADAQNHKIRVLQAAAATLTATPAAISIEAAASGAAVSGGSVQLGSNRSGLPYRVTVRTANAAGWLRVSPESGVLPASITATADPGALPAGDYSGELEIVATGAVPDRRVVMVRLRVVAAEAPKLRIGTPAITLHSAGGAQTVTASIRLLNDGGGSAPFEAGVEGAGTPWLSVSPARGAAGPTGDSVTVTARTEGLASGVFSGAVIIRSTSLAPSSRVPVTLVVGGVGASILLSQTGLTFRAVEGGGPPIPQSIGILNSGVGRMAWTVEPRVLGAGNWLSVSETAGVVPRPLLDVSFPEVGINPAGLGPGEYFGQVRIVAPDAANSPQIVTISLTVLPRGSNPGPEVRPSGLVFLGVEGSVPTSQDVKIANPVATPFNYISGKIQAEASPWFGHYPSAATVSAGKASNVVVQADFSKLPAGIYRGIISFLALETGESRNVGILSVVAPRDAAEEKGVRGAGGCTPKDLVLQSTSSASTQITAALGEAVPIEVVIVDDCGSPLTHAGGGVTVSFDDGDKGGAMAPLPGGKWTKTYQPRNSAKPVVTATILGIKNFGLTTFVGRAWTMTITIRNQQSTPLIAPGAVVSAASYQANAPVAPGALLAIYGSRLSEGAGTAAMTAPLPTLLSGTEVRLGDRPLSLFYAGDGQINAQVPFDLVPNTVHSLLVKRGNTSSLPESIVVAAAQPAIFSINQQGTGQGAITDGVTGTVADAANPVSQGRVITIYCTGLGVVTPEVSPGALAPSNPLSRTVIPIEVSIGGRVAEVSYSGLTPGAAGLYQVNATVPVGTGDGTAIPVTITAAGQTSNTVTIAVR